MEFNEKKTRNFAIFNFVILIFTYLDVGLSNIKLPFVILASTSIPPNKLLVILIILYIYTFFRYLQEINEDLINGPLGKVFVSIKENVYRHKFDKINNRTNESPAESFTRYQVNTAPLRVNKTIYYKKSTHPSIVIGTNTNINNVHYVSDAIYINHVPNLYFLITANAYSLTYEIAEG